MVHLDSLGSGAGEPALVWEAWAHLGKVRETSHMKVAGSSLKEVCGPFTSDTVITAIALALLDSRSQVIVQPLLFPQSS